MLSPPSPPEGAPDPTTHTAPVPLNPPNYCTNYTDSDQADPVGAGVGAIRATESSLPPILEEDPGDIEMLDATEVGHTRTREALAQTVGKGAPIVIDGDDIKNAELDLTTAIEAD